MPFEIAALAEPLGCVLNGLEAAQSSRAENAMIFGAGPIGMLLALGLKAGGNKSVDLVADATGVPAVAGKLTNYIANGGVGLFFGVCPSEAGIEISPFELFRRQLTLAGSHSLNHNIPEALSALGSEDPERHIASFREGIRGQKNVHRCLLMMTEFGLTLLSIVLSSSPIFD